MRKMVKEKAKRIFAEQTGPSKRKALEEVLSDIFIVRFEEANTGSKNASSYFIESVPTEMT